jgi:GNAT superfamily N-acetyltransferase
MVSLQLDNVHGPARREIVKGLRAYNVSVAGKIDHRPLTVTLRERREIVGGLVGETFFGWLFVALLWIADEHRGKGFGKSLIETAEEEARRRGARNAYLDTFSFQAPGFYEKLGYRAFGRLDEFPAGYHRLWMTKAL